MGVLINNNLVLTDIEKLPPTPKVLLKLIEQCHKIDCSFDELAETILLDAVLTAKIISIASSPDYTRSNEITLFSQLLAELGLFTIRTIAITSAVQLFFSQQETKSNHFLAHSWNSALTTAYISRSLAKLIGYPSEDEAHCAGLLHKLGQLALLWQSPRDYIELDTSNNERLADEEQQLFGHSYNQVGARIVNHWQLNSFMQDALQYQLEPTEAILDAPRLVKLVNFASKISHSLQTTEPLLKAGKALFGLNQAQLDEVITEATNNIQQSSERVNITLSSDTTDLDIEKQLYNQEVNLDLARQVRNIAFLDTVRQHLGTENDLDNTFRIIQQDLNILFGLSHSICFLYNIEQNNLTATKNFFTGMCESEFQIPVIQDRNLIANSVLQQRPLFSSTEDSEQPLTVIDRQLIQILGGEEIVCIPLLTEQQTIGILVAGFNQSHYPELKKQLSLINYFSSEAARAIELRQLRFDEQQHLLETERSRQLEHTEKLLHEANNPLSIINNYLHLLAASLGEDHDAQSQLVILKEEMERVTNILWRIKDQPQIENSPQGEVNLNELIFDLLSIFRASLFTTHSIQEVLKPDDTIEPIPGNRNNLKQIITNLVKNAIEAMPDGGTIELGTRGRINVGGQLYVELTIADTGQGMSPATLNNLFNPIASQKGKSNSGVGLTIVKKLISDMQGTISCRSDAGIGTEFQILLPVKTW